MPLKPLAFLVILNKEIPYGLGRWGWDEKKRWWKGLSAFYPSPIPVISGMGEAGGGSYSCILVLSRSDYQCLLVFTASSVFSFSLQAVSSRFHCKQCLLVFTASSVFSFSLLSSVFVISLGEAECSPTTQTLLLRLCESVYTGIR